MTARRPRPRDPQARLPWAKWSFEAWETDAGLALCSMGAQGFWMRLLCIAAKERGYVLVEGKVPTTEELAFLTRQEVDDVEIWLEELETRGVFSRASFRGVSRAIYSRRMVRDFQASARNSANGKKGGNPALKPAEDTGENEAPDEVAERQTVKKVRHNRAPVTHGKITVPSESVKADKESESERDIYTGITDSESRDGLGEIPAGILALENTGRRAWGILLKFLELRIGPEKSNRSLVAKIQRDHNLSDEELERVARDVWKANPEQPRPYLVKLAQGVAAERRYRFDVPLAVQRKWVREFVDEPMTWRNGERGGRPGSDTCKIDPNILREFGFEPPSWRRSGERK